MSVRHFLSFMDYSPEELIGLIRRGSELKDLRNRGVLYEPLKNRVLGMVFEKASTRTRLSFEAGMIQLGGQAIFLSPRDTQLGRGEPIGDSARVMSRMLDGVMIRTFAHATLTEFAAHSKVPVINGLSDDLHPCQLLADMQTADDVLFMHCLPAHRGEEISEELLDDPRSVAWDQAENRLHAQKALLELLIEHAHYA
ncbi:hypothetical protein QYP00_22290 [Pseudomonas aeruginosa]|nr:hypothetical protein [Pseudomonas aeruginosa]